VNSSAKKIVLNYRLSLPYYLTAMDTLKSRYQHPYIRQAHHHHHHHQQQQQQQQRQAREQVDLSHDDNTVKSTTTSSSCSSVYDVTDDDMKRGGQYDVISSLRRSSSPPISALSRPLYIHRPFEHSPTLLELKDAQRCIDDRGRDYRLQAVVHEPRHGWLAHQHYQLGSALDAGCAESWQRQQLEATVKVDDDEVDSSGDSACCDDDDVCDLQVLEGKMNNTRPRYDNTAAYSDVSSDDTAAAPCTRSESNHCQTQHNRKPGSYVV